MIMNPTAIKHVVVDGHSLTLESFVAIARYNATVELAPSALEAMKKSRALAEKIAAEGRVAYGITTGFGEFQKVAVPKEMSNQLSTNLILSHCTAAGEPYADEIVRGMMLLRANALCGGVSGVRPLLVEMLLEMLNKGVTPVVPQKGSLGSSGDLAPLAHMTLPMLGKGEAMYEGVKMTGAEAMAKAGIATLDTLVSKEGLGMTNGTCAMTSVGALALYDSICAAQLGDALEYVREKVEIELNAVTDNPLMFLDDEAVISGGNFHGEPMALPFDFLGIAASEIADASERRTERMVNPALSNGLTAFLTTQAGVNSGFMIVQYAAASMVSENKVYAHPASVDSIPSSANQEDIVSMGTTAARKAKMILQNTQDVLADELLTACQAIDIRRRLNTHGQGLTPLHEAIYQHVRKEVAFYEVDREIWPDIRAVEKMIRSGELLDIVKKYIPDFE